MRRSVWQGAGSQRVIESIDLSSPQLYSHEERRALRSERRKVANSALLGE